MIYQPIPLKAKRKDCEERYAIIRKYMTPLIDRTLIDICCANGYFGFRFLQENGLRVVGVENNIDYINLVNILSKLGEFNFDCVARLPDEQFDYGIYLDTHFARETGEYLLFLAKNTKMAFISSATDNKKLEQELKRIFTTIENIYEGFNGRAIYKCV